MTRVIGVRFRPAGKIYYFAPGKFHIRQGDKVIVETARGIEFGTVVTGPKEVKDEEVMQPLKSVIRIATEEDKRAEEKNREKEKEAFEICLEKIRKHNLDMKLINAEYTFDNNKVLFYFTADGRIDFRELVKDLAAVFRTRIELRQIGVRDETKIRGRNRNLRTSALLSHIFIRVCTGINQDGKRTEPFFESDENFRCVWKADVLSDQ